MQISSSRISDIHDADRMFNRYEDVSFKDYLKDRYERTSEYLERASSSVARQFLDRSRKIFDSYHSAESMRRTRQAIRSAKGLREADSIYSPKTLDDLRAVGWRMQRFLMAEPDVRRKFHRQLVDGYSESYVDMHPGDVGGDHYDWRRVTNGIYREEIGPDGEPLIVREVFYEQLVEGDRELDPEEQFRLLDAWDIQKLFLEAGLDPTNRLGGNVG